MGNWRIVIEGTGPHHNGSTGEKDLETGVIVYTPKVPSDADKNMWEFIDKLKQFGHKINLGRFEVIGGQVEYVDTRPIMHHPV